MSNPQKQSSSERKPTNLSDKQIHAFALKLSQHPEFASKFSEPGESYEKLAARIAVKLEDPVQAKKWESYLKQVGFSGSLQQFGAWLYTNTSSSGRAVNPIAVAMDNAVKAKKHKKLNSEQQLQIIADYLAGDYEPPKPRKTKRTCEIDDNEARAVQRLVLDLQGQSEVLDDWMDAIISRYFYSNSWSEMVTNERS